MISECWHVKPKSKNQTDQQINTALEGMFRIEKATKKSLQWDATQESSEQIK